MSSNLSGIGIHGNSSYMNFEVSFFSFPILLLFLPILYIPVTFIVFLRIIVKLYFAKRDKNINYPLFYVICISHVTSLLFFVLDFFQIRLLTAGVFTNWCANSPPNRYIIILFIAAFYVNYATMIFPFLVSLMRLALIYFPQRQATINKRLFRFGLLFIFIYPFFFIFFLFPAIGYCSPARNPFPFGAVVIGFTNSLFGLRTNYFLLFNGLFWMCGCLLNNSILMVRLIRLKTSLSDHAKSQMSHKAELSLTFTTFSMILSYLSSSMIVITFLLWGDLTFYAMMLRPFGNDLETCAVPWVLYLTHPVFRKARSSPIRVIQQ